MNHIEGQFPNLRTTGYSITSPETKEYNCIAWAAGDVNKWWEPDPLYIYYWPSEIPREYTLEAYIKVYEGLGYTICDNNKYEAGYEKVALYSTPFRQPTHAARQLQSGKWTSKLGPGVDIEHTLPEGLYRSEYGVVAIILKRKI